MVTFLKKAEGKPEALHIAPSAGGVLSRCLCREIGITQSPKAELFHVCGCAEVDSVRLKLAVSQNVLHSHQQDIMRQNVL